MSALSCDSIALTDLTSTFVPVDSDWFPPAAVDSLDSLEGVLFAPTGCDSLTVWELKEAVVVGKPEKKAAAAGTPEEAFIVTVWDGMTSAEGPDEVVVTLLAPTGWALVARRV